jgi:hypothetical protein
MCEVSLLKTKSSLQDALQERQLSSEGTIPELKKRLQSHIEQLRKQYNDSGKPIIAVVFDKDIKVDVICTASQDMIAMVPNGTHQLHMMQVQLDGVGVRGTVMDIACKMVNDMCVSSGYLIIFRYTPHCDLNYVFFLRMCGLLTF